MAAAKGDCAVVKSDFAAGFAAIAAALPASATGRGVIGLDAFRASLEARTGGLHARPPRLRTCSGGVKPGLKSLKLLR